MSFRPLNRNCYMPDPIKLPLKFICRMRMILHGSDTKKIRQLNIEGRENLQKEIPKGKKNIGKKQKSF